MLCFLESVFCLLFSFTVLDPSGTFYQAVVDKKQNGDFNDMMISLKKQSVHFHVLFYWFVGCFLSNLEVTN